MNDRLAWHYACEATERLVLVVVGCGGGMHNVKLHRATLVLRSQMLEGTNVATLAHYCK